MTIGQPLLRPLTDDDLRKRIVVRTNHGKRDGSALWAELSAALEENFLPAREILFGKSREVKAPFSRIALIGPAANASKKYPVEQGPVAWRDLLPEARIDVASCDWDNGPADTCSYFGFGVWVNDGSQQPIGTFEIRNGERGGSPIVSWGRGREPAAWFRAQTGVCFSLLGTAAPAGPAQPWPDDSPRTVFFFGKLHDHAKPEFCALDADAGGMSAVALSRYKVEPANWWEKDCENDWHKVVADGRLVFQFRSMPDASLSRLLPEPPRDRPYLEVAGLWLPWPGLDDVQRVWVDWTLKGILWTKALLARRWSLVCDASPTLARTLDRDPSMARVFDRDTRRPEPRGADQCYHIGGRRIQVREFGPHATGEDPKLRLLDVGKQPLGFVALPASAGTPSEWNVEPGFNPQPGAISLHWLDLAAHVVTRGLANIAQRRVFGLASYALADRRITLRLDRSKIEVEDMKDGSDSRPTIRRPPLKQYFTLGPLMVRVMPAAGA